MLFPHRLPIPITPAESTVQDVADEPDDAAREVREDYIEELIRAVSGVARGRSEAGKVLAARCRWSSLAARVRPCASP
jgi:hypothetical protein